MVSGFQSKKSVADRLAEFGDPVRARLAPRFQELSLSYPPNRMVLVGLKEEKVLELWVTDSKGAWWHLKSYPILAASGHAGPKLREGDQQVPEGVYRIESLQPNSRFHLALRVGYPNEFDRSKGSAEGRSQLGGDIMIHGKAVSVGCLAMGDEAAEELFVLAALTGLENVQLILSPHDLRSKSRLPARPADPVWINELYQQISLALQPFSGSKDSQR